MDRGQLIVPGKEGRGMGKTIGLIIVGIFSIILGVVFASSLADSLREEWKFQEAQVAEILGIFVIAEGILNLVGAMLKYMSFCDVYEYAVAGKTTVQLKLWGKSGGSSYVELPVSRIDHVAEEKDHTIVTSCGQQYKFFTGKKTGEIAYTIRARLTR